MKGYTYRIEHLQLTIAIAIAIVSQLQDDHDDVDHDDVDHDDDIHDYDDVHDHDDHDVLHEKAS